MRLFGRTLRDPETQRVLRTRDFSRLGNSNVLTAVDRKGQSVSFVYDALNRRTGATYADGSTVDRT
jgi:YD repeat-containing protein